MTERERLIDLIKNSINVTGIDWDRVTENIADYLLDNGVIVPPCKVGDKIYVIPSKTNYRLNIANGHTENNRIYEQVVDAIHIYLTGYIMVCCEGLQHQPSALYGETWFLTKEEAEKALEERENETT